MYELYMSIPSLFLTPQGRRAADRKRALNPRKLLLSKWTAAQPQNREKHFLVTELFCDEDGTLLQIELQAVLNQRCQRLDWRALENAEHWHMGWK